MPPLVISHRSNAGDAPENTIAGIEAAVRDGSAAVEVDVRATRDGALVLMHDRTLQRTTGDARPLTEVTLDDLRALRVTDPHGQVEPQPVPTLEEALAALDGRCAIVIDLPVRGLEARVAEAVRRTDAEAWTWFTVHPPEDAAFFLEQCPASTVLLSVDATPRHTRDLAEAIEVAASIGVTGINAAHTALTSELVTQAHERGLTVACWTVNEPPAVHRALMLGVDAITTDYPRRVFDAIEVHGTR
jgi:glycerophosphoryl diester phosphodiesterase